MDAPPPPPTTSAATVETHSTSLPPLPNSKLRLMVRYGGQIVSRPNNKSLFYAGGDTRIVAVDRRTTASSFSSFSTHLSRILYNNRPFLLKYQLPNEDLDSLISITNDEDLINMLEELDCISTSPAPPRIRLFLFPTRPVESALLDPKSESWFSDALKSTMIINRGMSAEVGVAGGLMGLDCMDSPGEDSSNSGGEVKQVAGFDSGSVPESMVLERCSSFGSTSSTVSMSNLPPIGVHSEDGGVAVNLLDKKVKVAAAGSIESDNSAASCSAGNHPKTGTYQSQLPQSALPVTNFSPNTLDSESIIYDPSSTIQMQRVLKVSGHQLPHPPEQKHQQEVQYIHSGPQYLQQYPAGPYPVSSYYPMYRPSQPYPFYMIPVRPQTQSLHPQSLMMSPNLSYKEVLASQSTPELAPEVYRRDPQPINQQQLVVPLEIHQSSESTDMASTENIGYDNEYDNDLAYSQIYKSQPSAPALLPKYQTMTKAATVLLSETSAHTHSDNFKQQVGASLPQ